MAWILLSENNIVIQKQFHIQDYERQDFIEAPDNVICGQIKQDDGSFSNPPIDQAIIAQRKKQLIRATMQEESDPLFFKSQAGEIDKQVWLDKRNEIFQRFNSGE